MILSKLDSIGVIACPGSRDFARKVVEHLNRYMSKDIEENLDALSFNQSLTREEKRQRLRLMSELTREVYQPHLRAANSFRESKDFFVPTKFIKFANGEFKSQILQSIRGQDIYVFVDPFNVYPTCMNEGDKERVTLSVNDHLMVLFTTIDACYHASASSINLVIPAYPYARQDKRTGREALTASRIAQMLEYMGANSIITLDIHSKAIENAFKNLKLENLLPTYQICKALSRVMSLKEPDLVMVSPDTGAIDRNKYYASNLKRPLAFLYKERDYSRVSTSAYDCNIVSQRLLGDVQDKRVFMADDMLGTGGTMIEAMKTLKKMGARDITVAVSLPLFSGDAINIFHEAYEQGIFSHLIATDAVCHNDLLLSKPWYVEASVAKLFAEAIWRAHHNIGMASLLDSSLQIQRLLSRDTKA